MFSDRVLLNLGFTVLDDLLGRQFVIHAELKSYIITNLNMRGKTVSNYDQASKLDLAYLEDLKAKREKIDARMKQR